MKREDVNIKETWDLSLIYKNEEYYKKDLEAYKESIDNFVESYKGKIKDFEVLDKSLKDFIKVNEYGSKLGAYASLPVQANAFDEKAVERYYDLVAIGSQYGAKLAFYENELLDLDNETLEKAKEIKDYKVYIEELLDKKDRLLSKDVEEALTSLSSTLSFPYRLYNDTKSLDIQFPDFNVDGKDYKLSYNSFEGAYEYDQDTKVRRKAFETFSKTIGKYQHTTASTYNAQVQKEKTLSKMRGYESVIDYLLDRQKVSRDLYNRQMDVIMEDLAPHMRKYAGILKRIHNLDEIRYSDLKIEVDPNYSAEISFDQAKNYVLEGLQVMGEDYIAIMEEAFENRWIDYANNDGKSTGAFASSPYGTPSFILMTFNGIMSDVMTLAHELGHAGHFQLTHENQSILNSDPSMYFVEAPSTTNELIVENHLLNIADKNNDLRMKRWVLSQMVAKTYYHNFVTHLLEAYYQREVYKLVDQGTDLNAKILNKIFKESLEKFWGDAVVLDEGAELTWMRQPHYYMGLYPYTYSAGLTIGTQVSKKIRSEGRAAADQWKEVLKMGGTQSPEQLAKAARVDVSTDQPLKDTVTYIGSLINQIEEISKELGEI
ncbi:oligoendopeptidase F [Helcococcus massiliensis]|uniref:oligoendopeptidase F n=1 Tax=Helcococcus massiliensis TaxID=2040290 RepID=UPI00190EB867|nr:oligoendopeptidase F [Helcococcus massiliensis]